MNKFKIFFGRVGIMLYMGLRLYSLWSHIYRFLFEQRFKHVKLTLVSTLRQAHQNVTKLKWTSDSWEQLFDAVSGPGKVEAIISGAEPQPDHGTDCDEFASYLSNVIDNSLVDGTTPLQDSERDLWEATIMSVMWVDASGKYGGHNVCLLEYRGNLTTYFKYMDYGMPSIPCMTINDVARLVVDRYAPGGTKLAHAVHNKKMWTRMVHLG